MQKKAENNPAWKGGHPLCPICGNKIGYGRKICRNCCKNEHHPLWQGGLTELNKRIRGYYAYGVWRNKVFVRDNYTCQECSKRGVFLHAHHIKEFSNYPELRFSVDNGITLCVSCHAKTENYGERAKWKRLAPYQKLMRTSL